ncbi:MAG: metallophosphoesterase family protein [Ruminococcus sp.]|jgi:exonuclease SbcD
MDFIHTADIHLGASPDTGFPWNEERTDEIWDSFRRLIELARREQPQLFLIAGDLFHRQPLRRELKEINYLFSTIPKTQVVLIAGNHDYIKADSWYTRYPWGKNVTGLWGEQAEKVYIPQADAWVYGFSYHSREIREARYDSMVPGTEKGIHILLAHGGDEKHIPFRREKLAASGYDYIALGHIHRPEEVAGNLIRYAGALEPLDRSETGPHGFIKGKVKNGRVVTEFVPWSLRSYLTLKITVTAETAQFFLEEEIMARIQRAGSQNIFRIELQGIRDAQTIFDLRRIRKLGNIVDVQDNTSPDYDLKLLEEQYGESLIGAFIRRFKNGGVLEKKALNYGLEALLEAEKKI